MAGSLNKVQLIGNLSKDVELKYTPQGKSVANFSIATNESYKNQAGEKVDSTEFHRIVIWGKLAEIANQYLKKGSLVYLEGKLTTRMWEKDGHKNYTTEVIANQMTMLGGKENGSAQKPKEEPVHDIPSDDFNEDSLPF